MKKTSYLLLILLAILAILSGIAAEYININNLTSWSLIAVWSALFLTSAGTHRSTLNWTIENIMELVCGMSLIYTSAQVVSNIALLPAAVLSFAGATYIASLQIKENEQ